MKRSFSDAQVGEMLRRATELQEEAGGAGEGLSLDEVRQIAKEMGISPEHLAQAAAEADQTHKTSESSASGLERWLGGPFNLSVTRVLASEISDDLWGELVVELNREAGTAGKTSSLGPSRTWTSGEEIPTQATLLTKGGSTEVLLQQKLSLLLVAYPLSLGLGGVLMLALGEISGISTGFPAGLGMMALGMSGLALACRGFVTASARKHRQKLQALGDRIQRLAATPGKVEARGADARTSAEGDIQASAEEGGANASHGTDGAGHSARAMAQDDPGSAPGSDSEPDSEPDSAPRIELEGDSEASPRSTEINPSERLRQT